MKILLKITKIFFFITTAIIFSSCLKEMQEKGLHISVPENNPIENLKTLTRDEEKTKILLLGVPPLSVLSSDFSPSLIEKLITRLSDFKPDVICLDAASPNDIASNPDYINQLKLSVITKDDISTIIKLHNKKKLNLEESALELDSLLNLNFQNSDLQLNERIIELAALNFDFYNAALRLSYLPENEIKMLKIDKNLLEKLLSIIKHNNENSSIGLRLANQLKLSRVYSINDLSDREKLNKISEQLYNEMLQSDVYNSHKNEILNQTADQKLNEGINKKDLFDFFLYLNSDSYAITSTNNNWSIYYKKLLKNYDI